VEFDDGSLASDREVSFLLDELYGTLPCRRMERCVRDQRENELEDQSNACSYLLDIAWDLFDFEAVFNTPRERFESRIQLVNPVCRPSDVAVAERYS